MGLAAALMIPTKRVLLAFVVRRAVTGEHHGEPTGEVELSWGIPGEPHLRFATFDPMRWSLHQPVAVTIEPWSNDITEGDETRAFGPQAAGV